MQKKLILSHGSKLIISHENGVITAERPSCSIGSIIEFSLLFFIVSFMSLFLLGLAIYMLYLVVTGHLSITHSLLVTVLAVLFLLSEYPCFGVLLATQSLVFPFKAQIDTVNGQYRLTNGLHRVTLDLRDRDRYILIKAFHSRGDDWGYYAIFKKGRQWIRDDVVVPNLLIGSKSKTLIKAKALKQFIEESVHGIEVRLEGWETKRKRKGVTHD